MKKNKRSIYKLYKDTVKFNSCGFLFKRILKSAILCAPAIFIVDVVINERFDYNENISKWGAALSVSLFPFLEESISLLYMVMKDEFLELKLTNICELLKDKTNENVNFIDANVSISGFQDNAKETSVTFEFDNFYIKECIKDDVYKCGLYYSDGGFTDLTNEVSDIIKVRGRRKVKKNDRE